MAGFVVTKSARRAAHTIGGTLDVRDKAKANRRHRRSVRRDLRSDGHAFDMPSAKLHTDWDVI